ncbi:MAG: hypothetical protein ACHP6H_07675, partial [Legionellales bacterium]
MDRQTFYFREHITAPELNEIYDDYETQFKRVVTELLGVGIKAGGVVGQHSPTPDGTVDVSPLLQSYALNGTRLHSAFKTHINLLGGNDGLTATGSYDIIGGSGLIANGNPITLPSLGNQKWVTVLAYYDRFPSLPQIDGNGNIVNSFLSDSFKFKILQGTSAPTATKPTLPIDGSLCLADILLTPGMTVINAGSINYDRKNLFIPAIAQSINIVTPRQAVLKSTYPGTTIPSSVVVVRAQDGNGNWCPNVTGGVVTISVIGASGIIKLSQNLSMTPLVTTVPLVNGIAYFYFTDDT